MNRSTVQLYSSCTVHVVRESLLSSHLLAMAMITETLKHHQQVQSQQFGNSTVKWIKMADMNRQEKVLLREYLRERDPPIEYDPSRRNGNLCLQCFTPNVANVIAHIGGRGQKCRLDNPDVVADRARFLSDVQAGLIAQSSRNIKEHSTKNTAALMGLVRDVQAGLEDKIDNAVETVGEKIKAAAPAAAPAEKQECLVCFSTCQQYVLCPAGEHATCTECFKEQLIAAKTDFGMVQHAVTCCLCHNSDAMFHPPKELHELFTGIARCASCSSVLRKKLLYLRWTAT